MLIFDFLIPVPFLKHLYGWQEYTEEPYKKDLHDQDNHDGVITHLEPDILVCKVKWAYNSTTKKQTTQLKTARRPK